MRSSENQLMDDMKGSKFMMSMNRGSVRIDGKDIELHDVDMKQLTKDSQKDITRLSHLQQQVANLTNLTMGNVEDVDNQFSMRQTQLTDNSQNR
jgi:hypothetical protein